MSHPYRELLSLPGARQAVAGRCFGKLAGTMLPLALLLFLSPLAGVAVAGGAVACYSIFQAAGHVIISRSVDRYSQMLLSAVGMVNAAAIVLLLLLASRDANAAILLACAAFIGASEPPTSTAIRSLWDSLAPNHLAPSTSALEAMLSEVLYVLAPLLVAGTVTAFSESAALWLAAALTFGGNVLYCVTPEVRAWRNQATRSVVSLRAQRQLRAPVGAAALWMSAFGTVTVLVPFVWEQAGRPAVSGLVFAAVSIGAAGGGLLFGSRVAPLFTPTRLGLVVLLQGVTAALFVWAGAHLAAAVAVAALYGVANAVTFTWFYVWAGQAAPAGARTEAYAYVFAAMSVGVAAASATASLAMSHVGSAGALIPLAAVALSAAWCASVRTP